MTFDHQFGSPSITLVSATSSAITLSLQGFLFTPTAADLQVILTDFSDATIALQPPTVNADGSVVLSPGAGSFPTSGTLSASVKLGSDTLACVGFNSCTATSAVQRGFQVDIPSPGPVGPVGAPTIVQARRFRSE